MYLKMRVARRSSTGERTNGIESRPRINIACLYRPFWHVRKNSSGTDRNWGGKREGKTAGRLLSTVPNSKSFSFRGRPATPGKRTVNLLHFLVST